MTARTHDLIAFASLVTVAGYFPVQSLNVTTILIAVIANNIGALIPDLDSASNKLWDLLPAGDFLAKIFRKIFWKHRTLSHSIIGGVGLYYLLAWLLPKFLHPDFVNIQIIILSIMIGYISHLGADAITKDGIPLLFPFNFYFGFPPISILRITTGSWVEKGLIFPGTLIYIIWFITQKREVFTAIFQSVA